jgi:hypothetical protein
MRRSSIKRGPGTFPWSGAMTNEPGLASYDHLIDAILAADIEPWLCFYHWDLPQTLRTRRMVKPRTSRVVWRLRCTGRDALWRSNQAFCDFNEPSIFTLFGHSAEDRQPRDNCQPCLPSTPSDVQAAERFAPGEPSVATIIRRIERQYPLQSFYSQAPLRSGVRQNNE